MPIIHILALTAQVFDKLFLRNVLKELILMVEEPDLLASGMGYEWAD